MDRKLSYRAIKIKKEMQEDEYIIPYHYKGLFAPAQEIERNSLFEIFINIFKSNGKQRILDIGCGDGIFCYYAKKYLEVEGLDISEKALSWARVFNPEIRFYNKRVDELNLKRKYDGAVCIEVLEHLPDTEIQSFIAGISKLIKSNGIVIFTVPSVNQPIGNKHFRHYNHKLLFDTLKPFFKVVRISGHSRIGKLHRKLFSLINIVSLLCYSDHFCWKFPNVVLAIKRAKEYFWYRYLHKGNPNNCFRLIAICDSKR